MSGFPILDLVVGIIFIYFLLSIICSSIVEMILTFKKVRSEILGKWLLTIFDTNITNGKNQQVPLGQEIMDHCTITALAGQGRAPSYIDAKNFVSALLDKIHTFSSVVNPTSIDEIIQSLDSSTAISGELKRAFLISANEAKDTFTALTVKTTGAIEMFRNKMENWYDSNMDRLTGTLKSKYTRRFTMIAAIAVTVLINADTIEITKYLYNNPEARAKVAAKAYETVADSAIKKDMQHLKMTLAAQKDDTAKLSLEQLDSSVNAKIAGFQNAQAALKESIPLGWSKTEFSVRREWYEWLGFFLAKLIGMAVTVIAVMMGTPFWFDILNKVANLRGAGTKPQESDKK